MTSSGSVPCSLSPNKVRNMVKLIGPGASFIIASKYSSVGSLPREANMIDHNRDGFIDNEDLHDMLASLGKDPTEEYLEAMMNEAPGPINFTMFLTLFGERL